MRGPWLAVVLAAGLPWTATAQTPPRPPAGAPSLTADAPLQCWWRTSSGAIRLGEIVEVTLTCAVRESETLQAVPDESRLSVAAIQLAPFEIVGGTHPPDTRAGDRRFFQYAYQLRIIDADVIGRDVKLPPLSISYRVQSRVGAGASLAGRDLLHVMPQIAIRVMSQVPADATDIRDSAGVSLARIDSLRFRSSAYRVAAMVLAALAAVAALMALVPLVGHVRTGRSAGGARVPERAVLGRAGAVLDDLGRVAAGDWPADAVADAHRAIRVVAATALGAGVRYHPLAPGTDAPEGRLLVTHGLRRGRSAVTASVTPATLARAIDTLPAGTPSRDRVRLERLLESLTALTRAQYARGDDRVLPVDDAVRSARDIAAEMARERLWSVGHWFGRTPAVASAPPEF